MTCTRRLSIDVFLLKFKQDFRLSHYEMKQNFSFHFVRNKTANPSKNHQRIFTKYGEIIFIGLKDICIIKQSIETQDRSCMSLLNSSQNSTGYIQTGGFFSLHIPRFLPPKPLADLLTIYSHITIKLRLKYAVSTNPL
jgi:hypothetical protein